MKALNITQYTGIDGLQYQDVPEPTPGPGQVTIRAEYAGVGYVDALSPKAWQSFRFPGRRASKPRGASMPSVKE